MQSADEVIARFRAEGRKITPQRQRVFEVLENNTEHPTAEAIWEQVREGMPGISLKTVYQTLHELADLEEIQALDLGTGSARFDPNLDTHHHLVCDECGRVHDLYADFTDVRVPRGAGRGYLISSTEITFRGQCPECAASKVTHEGSATTRS